MPQMLTKTIIILFVICCISSCSSGQRAIPIDLPSDSIEELIYNNVSESIELGENLPFNWWQIFQDSQLTAFIEQAIRNNPTFQSSRAKVLYSISVADRARSALYPMLNYGADVMREKFSQTGIIPFDLTNSSTLPPGAGVPNAATGGLAGIPVYFTQYETELSLSYNFDFWSKNLNTLKAAIGEIRAAIADELFARLELSIAVARTYLQLQVDYQRQVFLQEMVEDREAYVKLIRARIQNNLTDALVLRQAETNVSESLQKLLAVELDIAIRENQLRAFLAKNMNEEIDSIQISKVSLPKMPFPSDLPLNLIARRPDITSQLWLIESAGRQIEVAKAGFYPDFNLTAVFGFQTIHWTKLFNWPSTFYNVNPAVSLPIFDGGRLMADLSRSEFNYDLAILKYNELILNAVKEVLDGLRSLENAQKQITVFDKILNDQKEVLRLTQLRVTNNISSGLDELLRREAVAEAEDNEMVAVGNKINAILDLIMALGGGYECGCNDSYEGE